MNARGSTLIDYLLYVVIAVAIVGAITLAWHAFVIGPAEARGHAAGIAEQLAKDTPIISALTRDRDTALAANKQMTADVATLKQAVTDAGAEIGKLVAAGDAARARAAVALANAAAQARAAQSEAARLAAIIDRKPVAETLEGACARARDLLRELVAGSVL